MAPATGGLRNSRVGSVAPEWRRRTYSLAMTMTSRTARVAAIAACIVLFPACGGNGEGDADTGTTASICPQPDGADAAMITVARASMLIGLSEDEAEQCATSLGWGWRVGERDGEVFAVTADWSPSRVTVTVADGSVTAVVVG